MSGFKENKKELLIQAVYAVMGSLLFALGVNLIIVPLGLYNGGFMGVAQLLRTFFVEVCRIPIPSGIDMSGIIYFIINIPLFYMGLRILGKEFAVKTLITVTIQSIFLVVVPIPAAPIIEDFLTSCIIGGLIAGTGTGLVLRGRSSGGGQDIIGLCCAKKYPNFSVGRINIIMNILVYVICLFMFNIEIVIYSLIYTTVLAMALDRVHIQNINTSVMIFTKKLGISKAIIEQTGRGVTNWDGEGAYTNKTSYILFVMISKYEVGQIKRIVHGIDPNAFMIFTEGCAVEGNFEKRL
ncbi:membrane protein [Lachnospiraceae bacterium]|uniref:YitT family protein n=1 Tax=Extibacter sp. GGCC_0201 TaxID=2731209 RepID=UPI001AA0D40E|nr:YitT family protein [Extibacter sp. GGCC_0201]MBO1722619.1 YitT family protein [Extibacter sp. GGCC_0201]BDF35114.1 membrane protein [Lachnospiraceae bacterium]BDF39115.1 membrane protein [Lachnospiraceae bacterium]